jgi:hypothetical protein
VHKSPPPHDPPVLARSPRAWAAFVVVVIVAALLIAVSLALT